VIRIIGYIVMGLIVLGGLNMVALWIGARVKSRPDNVNTGTLAPCPNSPNCVSSDATDEQHWMDPISYSGSQADAQATLVAVLEKLPKVEFVTERPGYVYVETRSPMMSFVDDVEFVIDEERKEIQFRSVARVGAYDFGKNRERMEWVAREFAAATRDQRSRADHNMTV
jgi:uncharacterized protein (DUF1499 family)